MRRTFGERMRAAPAEFKAKYGEEPDYIDCYWFALRGRRTTPREREMIEAAGVLKPSDVRVLRKEEQGDQQAEA